MSQQTIILKPNSQRVASKIRKLGGKETLFHLSQFILLKHYRLLFVVFETCAIFPSIFIKIKTTFSTILEAGSNRLATNHRRRAPTAAAPQHRRRLRARQAQDRRRHREYNPRAASLFSLVSKSNGET